MLLILLILILGFSLYLLILHWSSHMISSQLVLLTLVLNAFFFWGREANFLKEGKAQQHIILLLLQALLYAPTILLNNILSSTLKYLVTTFSHQLNLFRSYSQAVRYSKSYTKYAKLIWTNPDVLVILYSLHRLLIKVLLLSHIYHTMFINLLSAYYLLSLSNFLLSNII